jgi:hypothetical protein
MSLKYIKKRRRYENSTGTLLVYGDHTATSYGWWSIGGFVQGLGLVVNSYGYSTTTSKHVRGYKDYLRAKGIPYIEVKINSPKLTLEDVLLALGKAGMDTASIRADLILKRLLKEGQRKKDQGFGFIDLRLTYPEPSDFIGPVRVLETASVRADLILKGLLKEEQV